MHKSRKSMHIGNDESFIVCGARHECMQMVVVLVSLLFLFFSCGQLIFCSKAECCVLIQNVPIWKNNSAGTRFHSSGNCELLIKQYRETWIPKKTIKQFERLPFGGEFCAYSTIEDDHPSHNITCSWAWLSSCNIRINVWMESAWN